MTSSGGDPVTADLERTFQIYAELTVKVGLNLQPGQPIRYRMEGDPTLETFRLKPPTGEDWPLTDKPGEASTYLTQVSRQERGACAPEICRGVIRSAAADFRARNHPAWSIALVRRPVCRGGAARCRAEAAGRSAQAGRSSQAAS